MPLAALEKKKPPLPAAHRANSFAVNPDDIKRREQWGLSVLVTGIVLTLVGLGALLMNVTVGLLLLSVGVALTATGVFVLMKIPDVVGQPEELW